MATFLALEEMCTEETSSSIMTPRQTEAVFKASKSLLRKQQQHDTPTNNVHSTKGSFSLYIFYTICL